MAEGELRATAAAVERDDRPITGADARSDGKICKPAFFLRRDDFERQPRASLNRLDNLGLIAGHSGARRANHCDGTGVDRPGLVRHLADRSRCPLKWLGADLTCRLEA